MSTSAAKIQLYRAIVLAGLVTPGLQGGYAHGVRLLKSHSVGLLLCTILAYFCTRWWTPYAHGVIVLMRTVLAYLSPGVPRIPFRDDDSSGSRGSRLVFLPRKKGRSQPAPHLTRATHPRSVCSPTESCMHINMNLNTLWYTGFIIIYTYKYVCIYIYIYIYICVYTTYRYM